jgi:ABC-2 type transport system ATP-binding protein
MTAIVEVDDIKRSFRETQALAGVSLEVPEGGVLGLLGPNGAGKTTLVRILSTLLEPDSGSARIAGFDVHRHATAVRKCIGLAGQYAAVDETLTGRENLEMVGRLSRLSRSLAKERAQEVLERVSLTDAADRPLKTYSGGMRRRIDLGAGLVAHPRVLLLDEPTTGLDPANRLDLWAYLRELANEGATILLTTQYLEEADQLASDVVVIDHGQVIARGTPTQLKQRFAADVLDVTVDDHQLDEVVAMLTTIGNERPVIDRGVRRVSVAVDHGAESLVEAVRRLDEASIKVVDIALRRPSLDDVFLALTGHVARQQASDDEGEEASP